MFGANKRLRDLGKDNVDYTNYDSASAKVRRYRQQVYGTNTSHNNNNKNNSNAGKVVLFIFIFFFALPTILPLFVLFTEMVNEFEHGFADEVTNSINEENIINKEDTTDLDKYDDYDVKWIKKYFAFFDTQGINKDNSKFALVDLDFNGIPEVFYITDYTYQGRTYHINRVYYINQYENVLFSSVISNGKVGLYYNATDSKFSWLSYTLTKISTGELLYLYKFDDIENGRIFTMDYNVNSIDKFENIYSSTGFELKYTDITDFDEQYYEIVDEYLLEKERINNFINDNNK